jgi:hypothetical protein
MDVATITLPPTLELAIELTDEQFFSFVRTTAILDLSAQRQEN